MTIVFTSVTTGAIPVDKSIVALLAVTTTRNGPMPASGVNNKPSATALALDILASKRIEDTVNGSVI